MTLSAFQLVRVPARFFRYFGSCLRIWLYARWLDQKGSGKITFNLFDAGMMLNRGLSTIRKYLAQACRVGLIRYFFTTGYTCTLFYSSLSNCALQIGSRDLGPIAEVEITRLENLNILCTEIEAQALQQSSFYAAKQAAIEDGQKKPAMILSHQFFAPSCELPAWALGRSKRWIYLSEGIVSYGSSQESIAINRNLSPRTISRHLSPSRSIPSPVRKFRLGIPKIEKVQVAQRLNRLKGKHLAFLIKCSDNEHDESNRFFKIGNRVFERKNNIYNFSDFDLLSSKRKRFHFNRLCDKTWQHPD